MFVAALNITFSTYNEIVRWIHESIRWFLIRTFYEAIASLKMTHSLAADLVDFVMDTNDS